MPAQDRPWPNQQHRVAPRRSEPSQEDEEGTIPAAELRAPELAIGDLELLAQEGVLAEQCVGGTQAVEDVSHDGSRRGPRPLSEPVVDRPDGYPEAADQTLEHAPGSAPPCDCPSTPPEATRAERASSAIFSEDGSSSQYGSRIQAVLYRSMKAPITRRASSRSRNWCS